VNWGNNDQLTPPFVVLTSKPELPQEYPVAELKNVIDLNELLLSPCDLTLQFVPPLEVYMMYELSPQANPV
jgi:hypothetical protein